jgi:hypothetical protein
MLVTQWSLLSEDFQILCAPPGRIHGKTRGYKWSLLKVREEKYKREHGEAQVESGVGEHASLLQMLLKHADLKEGRNQVTRIQ